MKKYRLIFGVLVIVVIVSVAVYASIHSSQSKDLDCSRVKKVTVPSDVYGQPDDIYTGQYAIQLCKAWGTNTMTEGGRATYGF